jgi:hypothetical protein
VLSVNEKAAKHRGPVVTPEQYLAHLLVGELLMMTAKNDLCHTAPRRCVLDDCEDRELLRDCIEAARICSQCLGKLKRHNVANSTIQAATMILRWARQNRYPFVLKFTLTHQLTALCVGIIIGWSLSFVTSDNVVRVVVIFTLPIFAVAAYARWVAK